MTKSGFMEYSYEQEVKKSFQSWPSDKSYRCHDDIILTDIWIQFSGPFRCMESCKTALTERKDF